MKQEPVTLQAIVQTLLLSALALGEQFNILHLAEGQVNALLGFLAAGFLAFSFYTRSRVSPV